MFFHNFQSFGRDLLTRCVPRGFAKKYIYIGIYTNTYILSKTSASSQILLEVILSMLAMT